MKKSILAALCVLALAVSASADTIAFWHFSDQAQVITGNSLYHLNSFGTDSAKTDYTNDLGTGSAKISAWGGGLADGNLVGDNGMVTLNDTFGSFSGATANDIRTPAYASGTLSVIGSGNNAHYFTIKLNSTFTDGVLSYASRGTTTGYATHAYEYSNDGGSSWHSLGQNAAVKTSTWAPLTVTLGDIFKTMSGPDQNLIRVTVSGATSTNGNSRFDNILISGVPEPASLLLLGLGGLFLRRRGN